MPWTGTIRPYTDADLPFLRDMSLAASYAGSETGPPPFEDALANPFFRAWFDDWPAREHDTALIAVAADGTSVGAAWYRCFPFENRSEGSVHPDIPEIGIGVRECCRGRGVGTALLRALMAQAKARGFARLSLGVDATNAARRLYARVGFRDAGIIMMAELD